MTIPGGLTDDEYAYLKAQQDEYIFLKAQQVVNELGPQSGEDDYLRFRYALNTMLKQANRWGQEMAKREVEKG